MARLVKLKLPLASAVALLLAAPLRVTVAPEPEAAGVMEPEMVQVWGTTLSEKLCEAPPEVAVMEAFWELETLATEAVKVPVVAPEAMVKLAGTVT